MFDNGAYDDDDDVDGGDDDDGQGNTKRRSYSINELHLNDEKIISRFMHFITQSVVHNARAISHSSELNLI